MPGNLKSIPVFEGLREEDVRALTDKAVIRNAPKNAIVVNEGDLTDSLYVILSGKVKVYLGDETGKELILDIKGPGQYFGEMVLDEGPRSASVMTMEPSQFAVISGADFKNCLLKHPEIALNVITNLIRLARGLNENVKSLAMLDVYGRVARMLLDLAVEQNGHMVIPEKLTQREMANRVGASREMINRILRDLSTGGYIKVESGRITIQKTPPARW
ncbi:MAG TPA: Crp/Fnr family transcriptional regulator [Burkholderiales bacterium]|nr:Crp/Fnr family transcriptional regulator [Burkholderiales bacterium]